MDRNEGAAGSVRKGLVDILRSEDGRGWNARRSMIDRLFDDLGNSARKTWVSSNNAINR